jgi:secreted trypsin-like serine protease
MDETGIHAEAIIGGDSSDPGEYPATGALVRGRSYRCTATMIAPDVVITAAHCLEGDGWGDFGFTLESDLTAEVTNVVPVLTFHQHPDFHFEGAEYKQLARRNDVAVVILEEPIFGVPVERLDNPLRAAELGDGTELTLCGYGRNTWAVPKTAGLKRDAIVYVGVSTNWELQSVEEDPQPCKGDSGGPVFVEASDGGRLVAGLVSRAAGDSQMCDSGAIYTRISAYSDWVWEAARDRDTGCAVGGGGRTSLWAWPAALLSCVLVTRRRRRGAVRSPR